MSGRLAGTRVFITGARSGIGAAVATLFAEEGAAVALAARRGTELTRVAEGLRQAVPLVCDVSDHEAVVTAIDAAETELGPIDVAVNCAGVIGPTRLEEMTPEVWRRTIEINLSGPFYVGRELGLRMCSRGGGQIINVASDLAFTGMAGYVDYSASKAGVLGLTRGLAAELAPTVRVNAVAPGPVDTPMMDHELALTGDAERGRSETIARTPLGRISRPQEIARSIAFLVTEASYATGAVLALDGGTTIVNRLAGDLNRVADH
jgi:NAD(P)-dependent dehydrogenase (short-subunit alcohol dehydrogenase family)